jgi:hypothetical protein
MTIAQGTSKQVRIARQSAKGTIADANGGKILRREQATFDLQKETYDTASEITTKQQLLNSRHGVRLVNGKLDGFLTPGTYAEEIAAVLRRDFTGVTAITDNDVTAAVTSGFAGTFTRATGSWLTDGVKIGMVVTPTGYTGGGAANNGRRFLVTGVTATVLTVFALDKTAVAAIAGGDNVTFTIPGKVTYVPESGHTNYYHTVEEWYSDASISERNLDVQVGAIDFSIPGSGNAKISFAFVGLDQEKDTTAYFTSPDAESTTPALTSATGALIVNGDRQATITTLSVKIDPKLSPADGVVGADIRPDVFRGKVMVTGSFSCYFEGGTVPDLYRDETSTSIVVALTSGIGAGAEFVTLSIPQIDLNSSTPDDGELGLKRTYSFTAEYNPTSGANQQTTIMVHDSQAA